MSNRPPRSSSIPVRNTALFSSARDLESVISIPFSTGPTQPRAQRTANHGLPSRNSGIHDQRAPAILHGLRGSGTSSPHPNSRATARSLAHSSVLSGRGTANPYTAYEPRIIRADTGRISDIPCPSTPSVSPARTRRQSSSSVRAPSAQRSSTTHAIPSVAEPVRFSRPAYLEHSALRHLLHTETPSLLPTQTEPAVVRAVEYARPRRQIRGTPSSDSDEDDMSPPRETPRSSPPVSTSSPPLLLPTRWSNEYRDPLLSVCGDGRELVYQGTPGGSDKDAAMARTSISVPPACAIFYYEVEITSKSSKSRISIGFVGYEVKISRLPGWEKNSWGYHGDTGTVCAGDKNGASFGPPFGVGDIIGCGIDFSQNRIFYTKNGSFLGTAFDNVGKDCDVYPAVGLCYTGESTRANFGQEHFKFDIEDHVLQQRNQTWAKIQSTPLTLPTDNYDRGIESAITPNKERLKMPINELVLSYLSHHGYARTARAFEAHCRARGGLPVSSLSTTPSTASTSAAASDDRTMDMDTDDSADPLPVPAPRAYISTPTDDIELRTRIVQSVIAGDIDTALAETQTNFPLVLAADAGLMMFKLRCRKFVELVLEAAELKKRMQVEECQTGIEPIEGATQDNNGIKGAENGMDVDDEGPRPSVTSDGHLMNGFDAAMSYQTTRKRSASASTGCEVATAAQYGSALEAAVAYGQELESEYKHRSEVRAIFKRTSVIMAYEDPLEAGGDAADVAGQHARVALATELNQAILQSQGLPAQPLLDRLYRQTAACLTQLALMGNGAAAFADMPKEFLDA
ncbi:hypothetical protein F5I97DRAFT_1897017 [Phlebopus sp. FC_14]|nr:hypothetical protein F5I97DRAFT_1897017 [Phlebopus sp. FC_14]